MSAAEMSCEEVLDQLFAFLDSEVDDDLRERIEHHLERCRDCFTRAEFERRLRERIQEASEEKAPERLHRRIRRLVNEF